MTMFKTVKDIIEGTKLLTPEDYTHIKMVEYIWKGKRHLGKTACKVIDREINNVDCSSRDGAPRYEGNESSWELIHLVDLATEANDRTKAWDRQYRYTKEQFVLHENLTLSSNVMARKYDAMGHKGYEKLVSADTLGTFKDFMDEL